VDLLGLEGIECVLEDSYSNGGKDEFGNRIDKKTISKVITGIGGEKLDLIVTLSPKMSEDSKSLTMSVKASITKRGDANKLQKRSYERELDFKANCKEEKCIVTGDNGTNNGTNGNDIENGILVAAGLQISIEGIGTNLVKVSVVGAGAESVHQLTIDHGGVYEKGGEHPDRNDLPGGPEGPDFQQNIPARGGQPDKNSTSSTKLQEKTAPLKFKIKAKKK
jgi:hypothetical protein